MHFCGPTSAKNSVYARRCHWSLLDLLVRVTACFSLLPMPWNSPDDQSVFPASFHHRTHLESAGTCKHARPCKNYIRMTSAAVQQDTKGLDLFLGFPRSGNAKVQSWQSQGPLSEPRAPAALVPRRASAHLQAAHAEECAVSELNRQQWPCKISQGWKIEVPTLVNLPKPSSATVLWHASRPETGPRRQQRL